MSRLRAGVKAFVVRRRHASAEAARRRLGQPDGALPESLWDVGVGSDDHLTVCGQDATSLADRYGTPLHVVNRPRLRKDFGRFRQAFARHWPNVQIGYSYKTNPLPGVLRDLHDCGAWAEVISHFELWLALELGVPPERIIYNGPAKSSDGLRLAISRGIAIINVDNVAEIGTIDAIARSLGTRQRAGVRVVTSVGWSGQFGHSIADGEADAAFALLASSSSIDACGLHVHLGTGIKDVDTYLQAIREVLEFARKVERDHRIRISHLDFGGGFGVPTVRPFDIWDERLMALGFPPAPIDPSTPPTIEAVAERIVSLLHAYFRTYDAGRLPMLLFEPGRAVTSSAQTLLLRVLAVKRGPDGSRRVILDGGKNLALPTGYEMHELLPASAMRAPRHSLHYFYGPLCHPGDVIARAKRFPDVAAGDIVAVMDAGAYFIPNQMNFSNPRAAAVMVDTDRVWPIRDRESFADIVRHDHWASAAQDAPRTAIVT